MQVKKYQLELDMEQQTGSNWERNTLRLYIVTLFNFYAGYIIQNARLNDSLAGIKISRRNINNLSYGDDTSLMAEIEEEPKRFLVGVKDESEKIGLKLSIQRIKIIASGPITSWRKEGEKIRTVTDFIFLCLKSL